MRKKILRRSVVDFNNVNINGSQSPPKDSLASEVLRISYLRLPCSPIQKLVDQTRKIIIKQYKITLARPGNLHNVFTCPNRAFTCPGQSGNRCCRALKVLVNNQEFTRPITCVCPLVCNNWSLSLHERQLSICYMWLMKSKIISCIMPMCVCFAYIYVFSCVLLSNLMIFGFFKQVCIVFYFAT